MRGYIGNLTPYLWQYIAPYGPIWVNMDPYGPYGSIRTHTDPYGSIRTHLGPYSASSTFFLILFFQQRSVEGANLTKSKCRTKSQGKNEPLFQKDADRKVNMKEINLQRVFYYYLSKSSGGHVSKVRIREFQAWPTTSYYYDFSRNLLFGQKMSKS